MNNKFTEQLENELYHHLREEGQLRILTYNEIKKIYMNFKAPKLEELNPELYEIIFESVMNSLKDYFNNKKVQIIDIEYNYDEDLKTIQILLSYKGEQ